MKTTIGKMMRVGKLILVGVIGLQLCMVGIPQEAQAWSLKKAFKGAVKAVTKPVQSVISKAKDEVTRVVNDVKSKVQTTVQKATDYVRNPGKLAKTAVNFVKKHKEDFLVGALTVGGGLMGVNPLTVRTLYNTVKKGTGLGQKAVAAHQYLKNPKNLKALKGELGTMFLNKMLATKIPASVKDIKTAQSWVRQTATREAKSFLKKHTKDIKFAAAKGILQTVRDGKISSRGMQDFHRAVSLLKQSGNLGKAYLQAHKTILKQQGAMLQLRGIATHNGRLVPPPVDPRLRQLATKTLMAKTDSLKIIVNGPSNRQAKKISKLKFYHGFSSFAKSQTLRPMLGRASNPAGRIADSR